jgi:hypothetical protein
MKPIKLLTTSPTFASLALTTDASSIAYPRGFNCFYLGLALYFQRRKKNPKDFPFSFHVILHSTFSLSLFKCRNFYFGLKKTTNQRWDTETKISFPTPRISFSPP